MDTPSNSGSENAKVCGEALQAAQKRVRLAFFLTMGASCIVLLIVINLWHSLLVHNELIQDDASSKSDYLGEYSRQIADQSFYRIPEKLQQVAAQLSEKEREQQEKSFKNWLKLPINQRMAEMKKH